MSLAIATCQPRASADPRANGAEARRMVRLAAEAGARLAHFPEGFLSGYAVEDVATWDDVDWPVVRRELEDVAALVGELEIWVVLGRTSARAGDIYEARRVSDERSRVRTQF